MKKLLPKIAEAIISIEIDGSNTIVDSNNIQDSKSNRRSTVHNTPAHPRM